MAASWSLVAACHGTIPNQVLTKPAAATAPMPPEPPNGPWPYRPSSRRQAFAVDQRAILAVRSDTITRIDTISSHAEVAFLTASSTGGVSGSVGVFVVQGAGRGASTPAGLGLPFPFRAEYSVRRRQLDFTTPRDTAPCASNPLAVTQSLRDMWFRPPDTLRVGTMWEDSSSYVLCRDDIPLRASVHRSFRITGVTQHESRALLAITRASRTTIEGSGVQFGESVGVSGNGSGDLVYSFDPVSGEVVSASGSATMDLSLRSRLRNQTVRQVGEIRIGRN